MSGETILISWVVKDKSINNIAIGEFSDAINLELLKRERIDCIINLREKEDPREIDVVRKLPTRYVWSPIKTDPEIDLEEFQIECEIAMCKLSSEIFSQRWHNILVHCTAGMDRAPFIVALELSHNKAYVSLADAYSMIKKVRPFIIEHYDWYWVKEDTQIHQKT